MDDPYRYILLNTCDYVVLLLVLSSHVHDTILTCRVVNSRLFLTVLSVLVIFALYDEDHLFLVNLYTHDDVCGTFKLFSVVWFCELCVGVNINDTFGHNLGTRA